MTNQHLQERAGRNIGIESLPVFLQAAGGRQIPVAVNGATTLLEGVEGALRTPFTRGPKNGWLFNTSGSTITGKYYLRDDEGNDLIIGDFSVSANSALEIDVTRAGSHTGPFSAAKPLSLKVGESLIVKGVSGSGLIAVPAFHDQKTKSSSGGGFSDGGVRADRITIPATSNGYVEVGPPPGIAWGGFNAQASAFDTLSSVQAINFDQDLGVVVEEYFVFEDGTRMAFSAPVTLSPAGTEEAVEGSVGSVSPYFMQGGILTYPNKLRYKLQPAGEGPELPEERVLLHFDVIEYDVPKDQT